MTKNKTSKKSSGKKLQKKKIIVTSVAVGAAGILGYFGWKYLKKKKESKNDGDITAVLKNMSTTYETSPLVTSPPKLKTTSTKSATTYSTASSSGDSFPLKKGSKGPNVKSLQEALIAKYGKSILPKYGADGDFGSETVSALTKVGYPITIDQSTFNVIAQVVKVDFSSLGKQLYNATVSRNYSTALSLLKKMQSTTDYSTANATYKEGTINGVRKTIVNGLLDTFSSDAQKQAIKFEFLRMGLQFDGSKWSLSGFDGRSIVTMEATTVWVNATDGVKVPPKMVLGNEVTKRLDYTLFENNGKYFLVNTKSVQYLN
jgi:peptidoglycan hydrolase-like protein with peptidoglycan-binding domain